MLATASPVIISLSASSYSVSKKSHNYAQRNKPQKTNDFATKEAEADILLGGAGRSTEAATGGRDLGPVE
jgi:hypothetical protein